MQVLVSLLAVLFLKAQAVLVRAIDVLQITKQAIRYRGVLGLIQHHAQACTKQIVPANILAITEDNPLLGMAISTTTGQAQVQEQQPISTFRHAVHK